MATERSLAISASDFKDHPERARILQIFSDEAVSYAVEKGLNLRNKDDLGVCAGVVFEAYQYGSAGQLPPKSDAAVKFIEKSVRIGLEHREEIISGGQDLLRELKSTPGQTQLYVNLAIDHDLIVVVENELRLATRKIDFPSLQTLANVTKRRKEILGVISKNILANFFLEEGIDDESLKLQFEQKILQDLHKQATLVRGMLAHKALVESGVEGEYSPVYFSDESLASVVSIFSKIYLFSFFGTKK